MQGYSPGELNACKVAELKALCAQHSLKVQVSGCCNLVETPAVYSLLVGPSGYICL